VTDSSDDRSAMARAYGWAARLTTISLEMALPALGGFWVDQKLGTKCLFLILGAVLGFVVGFWQLLKLAHRSKQNKTSDDKSK
jgi:F0F1-type ATP synthase assembly protein I